MYKSATFVSYPEFKGYLKEGRIDEVHLDQGLDTFNFQMDDSKDVVYKSDVTSYETLRIESIVAGALVMTPKMVEDPFWVKVRTVISIYSRIISLFFIITLITVFILLSLRFIMKGE